VRSIRATPLLKEDPDLAAGMPVEDLALAEQSVVVPMVELPSGPADLGALDTRAGVRGHPIGCIVLEGVLTVRLRLAERECCQLVGRGDVLSILDDASLPLPATTSLTVERTAVLAVLDDRFVTCVRRWPHLLVGVQRRVAMQERRAQLFQAITQLPRVEDRLLAMFWCLANHWGTMTAAGVIVDLDLTHETLGRMVGARRPTVSLGLKALADDGTLTRDRRSRWRLTGPSIERLRRGSHPSLL